VTNVSDLFPAGGGNNTIEMVASGALSNGDKVVLQSDGTVKVVVESLTSIAESIPSGSKVVFNAGSTNFIAISFDPNTANKFVVAYMDEGNSQYGTAVVGTVSGTSITFGSEIVFNSVESPRISVAYDPNTANKFVIVYEDVGNSSYGTSMVGTVSGTSITFSSKYVFNSGGSYYNSLSFDPNTANKFVVSYRDIGNSYYGTAIVGTVSGTSLSFGTEVVFNSGQTLNISVAYDPNTANKFVITYRDFGNSLYGTAIVGTVSGTSISFGTEVVFNAGDTDPEYSLSFDPNTANKFVIAYEDIGNSSYGTVIVGTVSGTSLSFGTEVVFNSVTTRPISISFDPNTTGKFVAAYRDYGNSLYYGTAIVGTVSGTTVSFGTESIIDASHFNFISLAFDPNAAGKFVVAYGDYGNSLYGTAIVGQIAAIAQVTNLTSTNLLGIAQKSVSDTETVKVETLGGLATNLSGLTIGSKYYVQDDGTTTTSSSGQFLGRAITATTINMKDFT